MSESASFGDWIRRRRKALDLTREALAQQVGCAVVTIRKIETDERRPSRQVAERLAECLQIPPAERPLFLQAARAELAVDRLVTPTPPLALATTTAVATAYPTRGDPSALPSGTITFLVTDVAGSTQLWEQHRAAMQEALTCHDAILRQLIAAHGGVIFKTVGDGVHAAFTRAPDALAAAITIQRALYTEAWGATGPLRIRMALHTGAAEERDGDYFGPPLNRVARLMAAGHGGQILLTRATQELVRDDLPPDVELRDLGMHRLKDLTRPEQVFQVATPGLPAAFPPLNTLARHLTNLPVQPTPLIGREREVAEVCDRLRRKDVRLLTLTGPGGVGKTRLALQVAAELLNDFAQGVYFANLAPLSDPSLVVSTIAQTLGVREAGSQPLMESLKAYLRDRHLLLVLDNFEQILAAAPLVSELLAAAPHMKILVTSRSTLHLSGEHEYSVPPLALPDLKHLPASAPDFVAALSQYAAVELFIQRSVAVKPDFSVTNATAPAVAEICSRLDGLPLAIELAAARSKLFLPQMLLSRLGSRLKALTGGARDLPARQQTLRNTIDWSYNLLDAGEQSLLARLGVFVGGCTLDAIEAVCNVNGDMPTDATDGVASLVDRSLLRQVEGADGEPHFVMLETIREYALERLEQSEESEALRHRHAAYYLTLAEEAEPELRGPQQVAWLDRLEAEHDNFRAVLEWSQSARGNATIGLRLSGSLGWFWHLRGYLSEGRARLAHALARNSTLVQPQDRAKAFLSAGILAYEQSDYPAARMLFQQSLARYRELGDMHGTAYALNGLGFVEWRQYNFAASRAAFEESLALSRAGEDTWLIAYSLLGLSQVVFYLGDYAAMRALGEESLALFRAAQDLWGSAYALFCLGAAVGETQNDYAGAVALFEESLALHRELGNKQGVARLLNILGWIIHRQGDNTRAAALLEECLVLFRQLGEKRGVGIALGNLGFVMLVQGNYARAASLFKDSLTLCWEVGDKHHLAHYPVGLAGVVAAQGQPERAVRLLSAAEALRDALGYPVVPDDQLIYNPITDTVRAQLDEATFVAAWAAGQAMTLEQAIAYALGESN